MKQIKFYCPNWGSKHLVFQQFARQVKEGGYDGVEMGLPLDPAEKKEILKVLQDFELELIGQHWETNESDFNKYKLQYEKYIQNLIEAQPILINSQTGKDYFSRQQNLELINLAQRLSQQSGVLIVHETHRGKFSFACHILAEFLHIKSDFELCLDVSHWFNVAESDLKDQEQSLQLAIQRTRHVHARVGHSQSAQVSDPRLTEWKPFLDRHLAIWDKVVKYWQQSDKHLLSITPEFGPFPYMQLVPFTQQPIASQWEVNLFMKEFLQSRYKDER